MAQIPTSIPWTHCPWEAPWTIWAPPPELAAQVLHFLLHCYVESPLDTAALILLPRVLQQRWSRMSRVVREVGVYQRPLVPFVCRTVLTTPVVVLLIPFHIRVLPKLPRLDDAPISANQRMHETAKKHLRGVLEALDAT
jgi:hypothetical protein